MWSKLKIRLISALIGTVFVLGIIFSTPLIFHVAVAATCFFVLYELCKTFELEHQWKLLTVGGAFAFLLLMTPLVDVGFRSAIFVFLPVACLMALLICSVFWSHEIKLTDVTIVLFMLIYGVLFPIHLTYIRMMGHGTVLVFLPFLGAWMPDTFAYFSGMLFGRHKLIPTVSPNKTVEGAIGAVVGSVLMFLVYALIISYGFGFSIHYRNLIFLSLLCGVIAQLGDLSASVIKRACHKKDFGNLIPGHGGILDRVDSLLFVAPITYYFLLLFEVVYK